MKETRREFFKNSAKMVVSGIVGAELFAKKLQASQQDTIELASSENKDIEYRTLGRTGLKIPVITIGTARTKEEVLRYGIEHGINFVHTSLGYSGGKSIRAVGRAIKGKRKKVYLGLKVTWSWDNDADLNKALKILGTDYVDVIFFNIHNSPERVASPRVKSMFDRWKKQGKVRFLGLTTHGGMVKCMESAIKTGWYDCLMPAYKLNMREEYLKILKKCKEQNLGFVAMKTGISPDDPKTIQAFLRDKSVTTITRTIRTVDELKKYIRVMGNEVSHSNAEETVRMAGLTLAGRCTMCGECTQACPNGLAVNDIVRSVDYYVDSMKDYSLGAENYSEIAAGRNASSCKNCGICEKACPNNVPVRNFISRSQRMFS